MKAGRRRKSEGPMIKTKDFVLRHIEMGDLEKYYECQQDELTKKGFMSVPESIQEARNELKMKIADFKKKKPFGECFAIVVGGEFAGYVELHHLNQKHEAYKGRVGYCVHPDYRGRGLASKAINYVSEYAFKRYHLIRIEAFCRTDNKASARSLEKAGFKLEGILRKNKYKEGKYYDDGVWARVR